MFDAATPVVAAGPAIDIATLQPAGNGVRVELSNIRLAAIGSSRFQAELHLRNDGPPIGRDAVVVFPGLPQPVRLLNASGTTPAGDPYVNMSQAIPRGGLGTFARSDGVLLEFFYFPRIVVPPVILVGTNAAPVFGPLGPFDMFPGGRLEIPLGATDPDGDPVTYSLRTSAPLPTSMLKANGTLIFTPSPAQLGTYEFTVIASDGALETSQPITLRVNADPVTTSRVSGFVRDVDQTPLAGMQVEIGAVQGLTQADGSFLLDLGAGPLVSDTLKIRGETFSAGSAVYPFIAEKLPLLLEHDVFASVNNVIGRPIFLPRLDVANGTTIDPMQDTMVTTPAVPGVSVMVHAGTLMNQQGTPFQGVLSVTEVPVELTPAALPSNLIPDMVVTIQPGEMVFAAPAPLTFPNRLEYPPGTLFDLWSINPVTGQFDDVGDMRVSTDGSQIETISGGIRNSSWHFPNPQPQDLKDETKPPECPCEGQEKFLSDVGLYSGTHLVTHELASYQSQGEQRGITLRYDSQRAHPMGTVQFSYDVVAGQVITGPTPPGIQNRMTATLSLTRGDTRIEPPGDGGSPGSSNAHFWSLDGITIGKRVGAGLVTDMSDLPTGLYGYELSSGFLRTNNDSRSGTLSTLRGQLTNVNSTSSPFGSGWGIAGLQELVENDDGSALLVDGDGGELLFRPKTVAGQAGFQSPPSDFSTLEKLLGGTYRRTLTDGTVYEFNASHRLAVMRDRNRNETRYEYDAAGLLQRIVDPVNQATTFSYIGGKIASITNPDGRVTRLTVDAAGNLAGAEGPDGARQSWAYDGRHLLVGETDPNGHHWSTEYNDLGKVTRGVRPDDVDMRFHAPFSRGDYAADRTTSSQSATPADVDFQSTPVATLVQANGNVETFDLTAGGRVKSMRDSLGDGYQIGRDERELVISFTNARGDLFRYSYDSRGNLADTSDQVANETESGSGGGSEAADGLSFPGRSFAVGITPSSVAVADLNADGRLDLVTANYLSHNVSVLLGNGNGGFAAPVNIAAGSSPKDVAVADLNGDGRLDLVTANESSRNVSVLLGDGTGRFAATANFAAGAAPRAVAVADLNGDGQLDLVTANESSRNVSVLLGDGTGRFGVATTFAAGREPLSVVVADLNDDGQVDLVTSNVGSDNVSVLLGNGMGGFAAASNFAAGDGPASVAVADFNGDDRLDLVTANFYSDNVSVLLGDGTGGFAAAAHFAAVNPGSVAVADFNDDDRLDLVTANLNSSRVSVLLGNGTGGFAAAGHFAVGDGPNAVAVADLNGDSRLDLVTANSGSDNISVLLGNGMGGFGAASNFAAGDGPVSVAVADFNDDDRLDLVTANFFSHNVSVLLGNGTGGFTARSNFAVGHGPKSVAVADVSGDGRLDLVIASSLVDNVSVLLGNGMGGFAAASNFAAGDAPVSVAVADFNDDDRLDLATANVNSGNVSVLLGDGTGGFAAAAHFAAGNGPLSVAVADFNDDDRIDLVTANVYSGNVSVLLGNVTGGFAAAVNFAVAASDSVVVNDLNGDGRLDLVTINEYGDNVSVLLGDGSSGFTGASEFTAGDGPKSVAVADFNDDDRIDLVTANVYSGNVSVLLSGSQPSTVGTTVRSHVLYEGLFAQPTTASDGRGNTTNYDLDPNTGNVQAVRRPDGRSVIYTYMPSGQVDTMTDARNQVMDYDYDATGRLIRVTSAKGTADESVTRYEYDAAGNVAAMIDGNNLRTEYEYDPLNRLTLIRDAQGKETRYAYDLAGNLVELSDARGNRKTYKYDEMNRRIQETLESDPEKPVTKYGYDAEGNVTSVTDPLGHVTRNRYDLRNRRIETIDPDGGKTQFRYDADGNLIALTDPVGNRTLFFYDGRDRLIKEVDPLGKEIKYGYDAADNLVKKTDRNGRVTRYEYDSLNRLVKETWEGDGNVITYSYDPANNLTAIQDRYSQLVFTYDALNRVKTADNAGTPDAPHVVLEYTYDDVGNVLSVTDTINGTAGATTAYDYDRLNRNTSIRQTGAGVSDKLVDLVYNEIGQYSEIARYSDLGRTSLVARSRYDYDDLNRLVSLEHGSATNPRDLAFYDYEYDPASRITAITDIDGRTDFRYDDRDQLTGADRSVSDPRGDESYTYDANGNRLSSHRHGIGYRTGPGNRLLSDGTYNYDYDAEGNTIRRTEIATGKVREFQWDHRNRLTAIIDKAANGIKTQEVGFTYDVLNRRTSKAADTNPTDAIDGLVTHFVYDREDVLLDFVDTDGSGPQAPDLAERYLHGPGIDQVFAQDDGAGHVQWHLTDHLGTVQVLADNAGAIVNHILYDSYGNVVAETNTAVDSRYLFTGREFDAEVDAYYYRTRYYDHNAGRFLNEDLVRWNGGEHLYRYVGNVPVFVRDPMGTDFAYLVNLKFELAGHTLGHSASVIGSDKDGWSFSSHSGFQDGVVLKEFKTFKEALDYAKQSGYTNYARWNRSKEQDERARKRAKNPGKYEPFKNNCEDAVRNAATAADIPWQDKLLPTQSWPVNSVNADSSGPIK